MKQRLWGDNFFDAETKKWKKTNISDSGKPLKRAFVEFIMDPLIKLNNTIFNSNSTPEDNVKIDKLLKALQINLTKEQREDEKKQLLKTVMRTWLDAAENLNEMIVTHLPSPVES